MVSLNHISCRFYLIKVVSCIIKCLFYLFANIITGIWILISVHSSVNVNQSMLVMTKTVAMPTNATKTHVTSTETVSITLDRTNVCASQVMKVKIAIISMSAT